MKDFIVPMLSAIWCLSWIMPSMLSLVSSANNFPYPFGLDPICGVFISAFNFLVLGAIFGWIVGKLNE